METLDAYVSRMISRRVRVDPDRPVDGVYREAKRWERKRESDTQGLPTERSLDEIHELTPRSPAPRISKQEERRICAKILSLRKGEARKFLSGETSLSWYIGVVAGMAHADSKTHEKWLSFSELFWKAHAERILRIKEPAQDVDSELFESWISAEKGKGF